MEKFDPAQPMAATIDRLAVNINKRRIGAVSGPLASALPSKFRAQRYRDGSMWLIETSADLISRKPIVLAVRTPTKPQLILTHPSPEYRAIDLHTVQDQATSAVYAVSDELARDLVIEGKIKMAHVRMALTMTDGGVVFLWPLDLRPGSALTSGLAAIQMASEYWIKVRRDENGYTPWQRAGSYRVLAWPPSAQNTSHKMARISSGGGDRNRY